MDLLEASAKLERIELLTKFSHFDDVTSKEKTVALTWIGELTEELMEEVRKNAQDIQDARILKERTGFSSNVHRRGS
ncbi:hypothetical protein ACN6UN_003220 [Cronobacter turicensis]|uniref:Uncharacterized protein n=1 Tax=Cronobacter universalis NCTC 9529 TaxID=1074000 RepID=A0AAC8VSC6_9ENTR|nr:hypothetical protein [Cronobacter universalis]ALB56170.1 hypothetical protein AFK65_16425 [Cronobacter universalis NCTC 9529]